MQTSPQGSIDRIRFLLRDTDPNNRLVSFDALKRLLEDQAVAFASEVPVNRQTQTITLTPGNYQKALDSTTIQYRVVERVIDDDGRPLDHLSLDQLLLYRQSPRSGKPAGYAVEESGSGVVTLSFWPTPDSAYNFTVYYQELPLWLTGDASAISSGLSMAENSLTVGTTWPFDEPTVRALEKSVATRILALTPNEELMKRGLSKDIIPLWLQDVERAKSEARKRLARQRRSSMIELRAW